MKAPLYKVTTNDAYPYRWEWDGKHFPDAESAKHHAEQLHETHWQVQIMGRAPNGKWVSIGEVRYNGNASVRI